MPSTDRSELRALILEALRAAKVYDALDEPRCAAYLSDGTDVPLAELDMDSLARMEFCIAIELSTGATVVPGELERLRTLGSVEAVVRERMA